MKQGILLYNGVIETMSPNSQKRRGSGQVDSLAYREGKIVAVGKNLRADLEFSRYQLIDLDGAAVYPGLVDAHTHLYFWALSLHKLRLADCGSTEAALEKIASYSKSETIREWIFGEGLRPASDDSDQWPTAEKLDRVTCGRPAAIYSYDQHTMCVNTLALKKAGITRDVSDPVGGRIERFSDGAPSGVLREMSAINLVRDIIPAPGRQHEVRAYNQALDIAYRLGVTGVHSFDTWDGYQFLSERDRLGKLGLRVHYYLRAEDLWRVADNVSLHGKPNQRGPRLVISGVKIFADGALGSQTALTFDAYRGFSGDHGIEVTTVSQMKKIARRAKRLNLPCAVHAIGDKAVANVIEAFSAVAPPAGTFHRLEHAQMMRKKDIVSLKRLGIVASMQPQHLPADIPNIKRYLGVRARSRCYLIGSAIRAGVTVAFGSDAPIEPLNPLQGIHDAVTRRALRGRQVQNPAERISVFQALYAHTVSPARAVGESWEQGLLLPGFRADLAVFPAPLDKVPLSRLAETRTLATIIDGKCLYSEGSLTF